MLPKGENLFPMGLCFLLGLLILLVALGVIPTEPQDVHAPMWVIGLAGMAFMLAGCSLAMPTDASGGQAVIGALLISCFAAIGDWVAFGPGERRFSGGVSLGSFWVVGKPDEIIGRAVFGLGGLIMTACVLLAWIRVFRAKR